MCFVNKPINNLHANLHRILYNECTNTQHALLNKAENYISNGSNVVELAALSKT